MPICAMHAKRTVDFAYILYAHAYQNVLQIIPLASLLLSN